MKNMTRREFLKTSVAGAVGAAALTCAPAVFAEEEAPAQEFDADTFDVEYSADIVVVGGGMSGLAAAVQASELGARVMLLETNSFLGGNGNGTEGIFAAKSKYQADMEPIEFADIVTIENSAVNYRLNTLFWKDLYFNSADNIDWLESNGVEFSGVVDNYRNLGHVAAFHWFKTGKGIDSYIPQMTAKAEENGTEILLETRARKLLMDGDAICGILATNGEGQTIKISCKAVILGTGGYASSADALEKRGFPKDRQYITGIPSCQGDGIDMAVEVGGWDVSKNRTFLGRPYIIGMSTDSIKDPFNLATALANYGYAMWVNEEGERFVDENCKAYADANSKNSVHEQNASYVLLDGNVLAQLETTEEGAGGLIEDALAAGAEDMFKGETIEELAENMGVDPEVLASEVARYNEICESGVDTDFSKPADFLIPLTEAPFYALRQSILFRCSIGGMKVDRKFRVLREDKTPINGLYAVGTDGCELYRESYGIEVPASCNANNINSGRTAAKDAVAYIG